MKIFSFILILIFAGCSVACYATKKKYSTYEEPNILLKPACGMYCDDINTIYLIFVNESAFDVSASKNNFAKKISSIIRDKKYDNKIIVHSIDKEITSKIFQFMTSSIRIEVNFESDVVDPSLLDVGIKMITPSIVYFGDFSCQKLDYSFCLDRNLTEFSDLMIDQYLFDQSILNTEYAN